MGVELRCGLSQQIHGGREPTETLHDRAVRREVGDHLLGGQIEFVEWWERILQRLRHRRRMEAGSAQDAAKNTASALAHLREGIEAPLDIGLSDIVHRLRQGLHVGCERCQLRRAIREPGVELFPELLLAAGKGFEDVLGFLCQRVDSIARRAAQR